MITLAGWQELEISPVFFFAPKKVQLWLNKSI
jgi:hypothetical protein